MSIKVNDFVIQAQVIQECATDGGGASGDSTAAELPDSVKKEIIDECLEKMKEHLEREKSRF